MRSLKITLILAAMVSVLLLTVSGQSAKLSQNSEIEKQSIEYSNYDLLAHSKKKPKPSNQ